MITLHANLSYLYVISVLHSSLYTSVSDYIPWVEKAFCIGQANPACMHAQPSTFKKTLMVY